MTDIKQGVLSFGSMTLLVGGLALVGLLVWGWKTGQELAQRHPKGAKK